MKMAKRILSTVMAVIMVLSCWIWVKPENTLASAANEAVKDKYLFAYFTGTSKEGQTIHLAVSEDGYNYTALRGNEPVIVPSKGVGNVRDPYIWYNEQDNYYYILATDLDFTDTGGTYSNNSTSFIIWRSEDLINWHDETMIDVSLMAHLIGDTRNMSAVWAPQVLWDGVSYVVYFTLACNATSWFDIVYLRTTDLMNPDAYYEFDYILGNATGNGTDNGYGNIDADIIYNPGDGKYYLFYKTECNGHEMGSTATGTSLKTIHYYVGDTPTGPFTNPGDTKWSNAGFSIFPNYTVSLEGCNSFWDNDGNLIMYVDEFEHTDVDGNAEAYFHIAKSNGTDFTSWSYPNVNSHNINDLSPRHGSVIKITTEEYNRLLARSYVVNSSSFPMHEDLEDHLIARYFTTSNPAENAVPNKADLHAVHNITMTQNAATGAWIANFTDTFAEIDLDALLLDSFNYDDGFTITFKAMVPSANATDYNVRFFDITTHQNMTGRTGAESYMYLSPIAEGNGAYFCTYNGPGAVSEGLDATSQDWVSDKNRLNRADNTWHEYMISSANGNVMLWIDGILMASVNRHTSAADLTNQWYQTLGDSQLLIGKSAYSADALFTGSMRDFCIYDCSMSYFDIQAMEAVMKGDLGYIDGLSYNGISTDIPTFRAGNETEMSTANSAYGIAYTPSEHYSNILYTKPVSGTPSGTGTSANPTASTDTINSSAITADLGTNNNFKFGIYYSHYTVLLYDGITQPKMPVMLGGRINTNNYAAYLNTVYPLQGTSGTADNNDLKLQHPWYGWTSSDKYWYTIQNPDGTGHRIGYNSSTASGYQAYFQTGSTQGARNIYYYANTLAVDNNIQFAEGETSRSYWLAWRVKGEGGSNTFDVNTVTNRSEIIVINYKAILDLRSSITENEYNSIMNDPNICPTVKDRYARAVYTIMTITPQQYDFSDEARARISTASFSKAIDEAVNVYAAAKAAVDEIKENGAEGGHVLVDLPAREATCTLNGLTHGSYCQYCGEVFEEQKVIAKIPHSFGDPYIENGVGYVTCSVCNTTIKNQSSEVRYENIFSLRSFEDSSSNMTGFTGSSVTTALDGGTITVRNNASSGEVYTNASGGTTRDFNMACFPVKGNTKYVVEATVSGGNGDVFIFKYDKNGNLTGSYGDTNCNGTNTTISREFTTDANTRYVEFRFDANTPGQTTVFSEIGLYTYESWSKFAKGTDESRTPYWPGDDKELIHPFAIGNYEFSHWQTADGAVIENTNQLAVPTVVVYGVFIATGYDVTYDSMFSLSSWAASNYKAVWYDDIKNDEGKVTDRAVTTEGLLVDSENGTITMHFDESYNFCRSNLWKNYGAGDYYIYVEPNTDYTIEVTATSDVANSQFNVAAVFSGATTVAQETWTIDRYANGTKKYVVNSGEGNTMLRIRFDNMTKGSTLTLSDIAMYKTADAWKVEELTNDRIYRNYYAQAGLGIGDLLAYQPERPGYTFVNWWADTSATAATYDENKGYGDFDCSGLDDAYPVIQNWQLYSQWTEHKYNIAFNANGGTGSMANISGKLYSDEFTLTTNAFSKPGYTFIGWSTSADGAGTFYENSATVSKLAGDNNATVTLYAQWQATDYKVIFDSLVDLEDWSPSSSKGTIDYRDGNSITITSNDGVGEATVSTPYFPVEPGVDYVIDVDVITMTPTSNSDWDIYIFFCDANGNWVDFADGETNRFSETTTWDNVFTAPDKDAVVKAQLRFDANGGNNTVCFNDIRVYKAGTVAQGVPYAAPQSVTYDSAYGTLPTLYREGYEFLNWAYEDGTVVNSSTVCQVAGTSYLYSKWQITDEALMRDNIVLDFDKAVTFNPLDNDEILLASGGTYSLKGIEKTAGTYGTFALNGNNITYTPTAVLNGIDCIEYYVSVTLDGVTTSLTGCINVAPASNVLYEEDNFAVSNTTGTAWETDGTADTSVQTTPSDDDVYGFDSTYNNTNVYSNGSALKTTVSKSSRRAQTVEFNFKGTGFDLNAMSGPNTGIIVVSVYPEGAIYPSHAYVVDTFCNDNLLGTISQAPVVCINDLEYGNYRVTVSSLYMTTAGALGTQTSMFSFGPMSGTMMIYEALYDAGLEEAFDADFFNVVWMDDDSVFNGGNGASMFSTSTYSNTRSAEAGLTSVIDSIRVYNPLDEVAAYEFYNQNERGAKYYNIMGNLVSGTEGGATITAGSGLCAYIGGDDNVNFDTYVNIGAKDELYISNGTTAVTFDVQVGSGSKIFVSMRAAAGLPVAKIGSNDIAVTSATEMYYDITDYVTITDGVATVTIQNTAADSVLSINNIRITGETMMMSTFSFGIARMMMMAPVSDNEPEIPEEETTTEETTTEAPETTTEAPEETTTEAIEETTAPDSTTDADSSSEEDVSGIAALINFLISFLEKVVSVLSTISGIFNI